MGAVGGAQPTHWPWEQLAWPERAESWGWGGQGGIKKECKSTTSTRSGNPSPLRAYSAPDPCLTTLLLHTQPLHPRCCNSPTASHTSLAWTVGPRLPLRKPRPHLWVVFIIPCMSYLILWVIGCRTISNVKYTTCVGSFTFCSLLIEDQLKRKNPTCARRHISLPIYMPLQEFASKIQPIPLNSAWFF